MILNDPFPMLIIMWPIYWLLLIPIILIESHVYKWCLTERGSPKIFWPSATANFLSILLGIPIAWGLLALIEFIFLPEFFLEPIAQILNPLELILSVTLGAAWITPYAKSLFWTVPAAAMFLLIPFFFVSIWMEGFILTKVFKISPETSFVKKACRRANLASHLLLFLFCLCILFWSCLEYFYKWL